MRRGSGRRETTRRRRPLRVQASPVRGALVAALDDWAACATDRDQQAWVLAVVRQADPDPWRDRVRDPATWDDPAALRELADRAPVAGQSPQLLAVLGARLARQETRCRGFPGARGVGLPRRLLGERRDGQCALRSVQLRARRSGTTARPWRCGPRRFLSATPSATCISVMQRWDGAIAEYEQAVRLDPENAWCHNRLGFTLAWKGGRDDEAIAQFREAIRLDANIGWSHYFLAIALERKGRLDEAVDEFREAARLLPEKRAECEAAPARAAAETGARRRGACRLEGGAGGSIRPSTTTGSVTPSCACSWETKRSTAAPAATCWRSSARPRTRRSPSATGRACLLLPAAEAELRQAVALTERAVAAGRRAASLPTRIACSPRAWRGIARAGSTMPSS